MREWSWANKIVNQALTSVSPPAQLPAKPFPAKLMYHLLSSNYQEIRRTHLRLAPLCICWSCCIRVFGCTSSRFKFLQTIFQYTQSPLSKLTAMAAFCCASCHSLRLSSWHLLLPGHLVRVPKALDLDLDLDLDIWNTLTSTLSRLKVPCVKISGPVDHLSLKKD